MSHPKWTELSFIGLYGAEPCNRIRKNSITDNSLSPSFTVVNKWSSIFVLGFYILANIIADTILIHRCYKIWGAKKKVIVLPVFISIINNEVTNGSVLSNTINEYIFKSFLAVNFLTNLSIPFMIAGRIWWIGNQVSKFLPSKRSNLARHTMAICLESGIMYPLALFPALVLTFQSPYIWFIPILLQLVGIAPTFIILVRVALGISIENVQDTIHNEESGQRDRVVLSMWEA
ncbi:hypothetical protein K435DRAFT_807118 [Dendrothele bispora CBS 962.96]|uniref:Uncharacterized protein n=1 Tax=Dendrothele bispora (strain CBS 962.96) TaxID=1314807 RepID=A0A4V4HCP1_DENBC|nr:hypothetical protein K435DRAFT_807118 [Dendrothele bispora CBS 962.96]